MVAYGFNTYAYTQFDTAVKENKVIKISWINPKLKISFVTMLEENTRI
jgi:hypothetical protein